jgi:hypothetical protein
LRSHQAGTRRGIGKHSKTVFLEEPANIFTEEIGQELLVYCVAGM